MLDVVSICVLPGTGGALEYLNSMAGGDKWSQ